MTKIGYIKIAMYNYPSILLPRKPIPEVDAKSKSPFLWILDLVHIVLMAYNSAARI